MIVNQTEEIAARLELVYQYGAAHWQNLIDADDDTEAPFENKTKYLLFLWHDEDDIINEYGACTGHNFVGELLLMVRSKLSDESQETKYKDAVRYLKGVADLVREQYIDCEGFRVKAWKKIEVYDEFNTNMDGLKIRFTIETVTT